MPRAYYFPEIPLPPPGLSRLQVGRFWLLVWVHPVLFSESGVGVVVLVVWIVSSIQVIQPLQSGVDCVAELVVLVNKHSLPILTLHTIRTWAVPCGKPGLCGGGATESSAFQRWHLREDPAPAGVVCEGRVEMGCCDHA